MWEALFEIIGDVIETLGDGVEDADAMGTFADASTSEIGSEINRGGGDARAFKFFASNNLRKMLGDELYGELRAKWLRRARHPRNSRGNPYNITNIFDEWFTSASPNEVKKYVADTVRKYLAYHLHLSNTIVDRAMNAINNYPLSKGKRVNYHKKPFMGWYYLYHEKHSDDCIYAIRLRKVTRDKMRTEMALRFMTGPMKVYNYFQVPMPVFMVMTMIPLTYLTKNGYLAGAWNFFWYSCITTGIVDIDHPGDNNPPLMPFAHAKGLTKGIKEAIVNKRLTKIMNQPFKKVGKKITYLTKPRRHKGEEHGW